jgi:hypothetical protein
MGEAQAAPAMSPAVLGMAEPGLMVLGSDGGPIVLLPPSEAGLSTPSQELGLSNLTQVQGDSNPM